MAIPFGNTDLNFSESLNNPGNLSDLTNDKYALGKINNLNVYSSPEQGIAALCQTLETIQFAGARTVKDIINDFVDTVGNSIRTRTVYINLRKESYLRDVNDIWGISPNEIVDLQDLSTRLIFAIVMTELIQQRNIYSYTQFIKGCALSVSIEPKIYESKVNDSSLSIESSRSAGFVSPATPQIAQGGSSLRNSNTSNYQQIIPATSNYSPTTAYQETPVYVKSKNYDFRDTDKQLKYSFPATTIANTVPPALSNLGFIQHIVVDGNTVYLNSNGDKARKLDNQTYLITYANGAADEVVKSSTTSISINDTIDKNQGMLSNSLSLDTQKTRLEKHIASSTNMPTTTKPLSTAQTILAAYRFR